MALVDDNAFPKVILVEGAAPATPSSGQVKMYAKADGLLYSKDDAGAETLVSGGAGGLTDHNHTGGGDGGDLDAPIIDGYAVFNEESAPSTPSSGTVAVYAKADGLMYSKDDAGAETLMSGGAGGGGGGFAQSAMVILTSGDLSTSSTSFVDATGLTVTLTTGATRCLVTLSGAFGHSGAGSTAVDIAIDGTRQGQAFGMAIVSPNTVIAPLSISYLTPVLSAGSHTIKVQWRVDSNSGQLYASTGVTPAILTVLETNLTT